MELKNLKFNDLEDMVFRMKLTFDESVDILDTKNFPSKRRGCTLSPGMFEISDTNKALE